VSGAGGASRGGGLEGEPDLLRALAREGVGDVGALLARARCVRDLPGRSNHVVEVAGRAVHLKREKRAAVAREAEGIRRAAAAGVPTAPLVLWGQDPRHGAVTGTLDLAPAEPLDDLLREGRLAPEARACALRRLAHATAALHAAGLHHRDLYLNHVFAHARDGACRIAIVDFERLGAHRRAFGRRVVKDLAALFASLPEGAVGVRERARFLLRYLGARGVPGRKGYDGLVRRIRRKAARIRSHVPRTPVGEAAREGDGVP
jgi:tRNA A-37 threonylcarbamoyl transferase component Bud32